jgi:MoxR-like ATPase
VSDASTDAADGRAKVDPENVARLVHDLMVNLRLVVHAPDEVLLSAVLCLLAQGHILIEDLPGTGKTTLAKALAKSTGCTVSRIQFTPDLETGQVAGVRFYNQQDGKYDFRPGPVFSNIVVGDEINRAAPRTQAVLLEAMQENQVTVGGVGFDLPYPFMVVATMNPVEQVGTFALPEAQLDRFMVRLALGYPPKESEVGLILEQSGPDPLDTFSSVTDLAKLRAAIADVRQAYAHERVSQYIVALLEQTRADPRLLVGASPRAGIAIMRLSKAYALAANRSYVHPDDVKVMAPMALSHRLILTDESKAAAVDSEDLVRELLERLPDPTARIAP